MLKPIGSWGKGIDTFSCLFPTRALSILFLRKDTKEFSLALKEFAQKFVVPDKLILNPIKEHNSGEVKKFSKECSMAL